MRIAVDGMGGDKAPGVVVEGSVLACKEFGFDIVIVGKEPEIKAELAKYKPRPQGISVKHASEVIDMDESPIAAVRKKRNSSISAAVDLVKKKEVDAIVTAGNTGAAVCATSLNLRLLEGVNKPGIMIVYPTLVGISVLLDVGANIDPKPEDLLVYGIMGDVYSREILRKNKPRVGLLNIGEEATKGTEFIKDTHRLLELSKLNFIGNVEGKDIFSGAVDIIVCDGFIGNVVLKVSESLVETVGEFLKRKLKKSIVTKFGAILSLPALSALKKEVDYSEYGGAPLLGIDGICIISHGRSTGKAIKNAIRVAGEFVKHDMNDRIVEAIKSI